jgi:hypothetical protein
MPATTLVLPANNATLSGSEYLDATASAGVTGVTYELSGNGLSGEVVATGVATLYGWLADWNTMSVPNGTYTLASVASTASGFNANSPAVTVTVDNSPPTTTAVLPANNATLVGSEYLDATASSGATVVTYELSGNGLSDDAVATGMPTRYGWLSEWNTTSVANGTYTLESVASYHGLESATSAPITVTVNNPPPTSTVLVPAGGANVSGTSSVLDASASANVSRVTYELSGGTLSNQVISTGTPTLYGWLAEWDTTGVPDGIYSLVSVAAYPNGVSTTSAPVSITVDN